MKLMRLQASCIVLALTFALPALSVREARSSRSIFGVRCFWVHDCPLEQKPAAYARHTPDEAGSSLCR